MELNSYIVSEPWSSLSQLAYSCIKIGSFWTLVYLAFFWVYHTFNIHEKFGIFGVQEPQFHYLTALKNWKVPFLWGVGIGLFSALLGLRFNGAPSLVYTIPDRFIFLRSPNLFTDIVFAIIGFYLLDLANYLAHRLNHKYPLLYKKYPVAHFVHHSCIYLNPMVVNSSPLIHLAGWSGMLVYFVFLSQNLVLPVAIIHIVRTFSGWISHLGCDPLPWLTRLNHRVGGWIPWIPLHHQYHHLLVGGYGNYGNVTCLWDYVFGTVLPDCVHNIETGKPKPEILAAVQDQTAIADFLQDKLSLNLP